MNDVQGIPRCLKLVHLHVALVSLRDDIIINYHNTFDEPYVFNLANDGREMCWNTIKPIQYDNYKQVFFTDCGFFCNYRVLELLEFKILACEE